MKRKRSRTPWLFVIMFTCAAVWVFGSLSGHFTVNAGNSGGGTATHRFLVEGPTPTPSPEGCVEGPLFATLTGPTIGGQMPRGFAQFRDGNHNELKVFVRHVNLPGGTILDVFVEGTLVGQITLRSNGNGQSFLDTNVPIGQGTLLEVNNGETVILSGDFFCAAGSPSPSPTPTPTPSPTVTPSASPTASPTVSPSPTPTVTPTPIPTPRPQLFTAVLRGDEVVPPVETRARGFAWVGLNSERTRIHVFSIFLRLTSSQTAASINCPALPGQNAPVVFELDRVGGTSGFLSQTFLIGPIEAAQLRAGLCYMLISSLAKPDGEIRGQLENRFMTADFDGDAASDISLFRPSDGTWYYIRSSDSAFAAGQFGINGDKPIAGDFDGDGKGDLAVFRDVGGSGVWYVRNSSDNSFVARQWGLGNDRPLSGDYDGDGRSDFAVFRPSDGNWYVRRSSDGSFSSIHWGQEGDVPITGDFDGDGRSDQAVFRPATGTWYVNGSSDGIAILQWGLPSDVPIAGDFDGDGQADIAVFRPSDGNWYINGSSTGYRGVHFGAADDIPVPGTFDLDQTTDLAVFRPSNGTWYVLRSEDNAVRAINFGLNGDIPITNY